MWIASPVRGRLRVLLLVDVTIGAVLVAAIGVAARSRPLAVGAHGRVVGWILVAIPLPLLVVAALAGVVQPHASQPLFVAAAVAFGIGALLLLARDDDDWRREADESPEPEWWPDFERPFRAYVAEHSRRRERLTTR